LVSAFGCSHEGYVSQQGLAQRILPPPNSENPEAVPPPNKASEDSSAGSATQTEQTKPDLETSMQPKSAPLSQGSQTGCEPDQPLTLAAAVNLAFRLQPRLRASLESIQQAQGKEDIAFAAFLPNVSTGYSVGGFDLNVGGTNLPLPGLPNSPPFTFVPFTGSLPLGLNIQTGYELAELKVQWLVCDFGRRLGRYNQAGVGTGIAQTSTPAAFPTST